MTKRRPGPTNPARRSTPSGEILVPVDFSPSALAAVRYAARLARRDGATLRLVYVFDVPSAMTAQGSACVQAMLEVEQDAKTRLAAWARSVDAQAEIDYRLGDPGAVIARCAEEEDVERIVMGARRNPGPGPMGSVARSVRTDAGCPVDLVVESRVAAAP